MHAEADIDKIAPNVDVLDMRSLGLRPGPSPPSASIGRILSEK